MDATTLIKTGCDPAQWLRRSTTLRRSADVVWDAFLSAMVAWAKVDGGDASNDFYLADLTFGHLSSAKMLYGLAFETAFKGAILRDRPSDVEFKMFADGSGRVQKAELTQLGGPMGAGHDLVRLAVRAGAFTRGAGEIFPSDSDYDALRAILEDLGDVVIWSGRYPIPLRSGAGRPAPMDIPAKVFGHYMRDWTDPVLDHFHARLKGPTS